MQKQYKKTKYSPHLFAIDPDIYAVIPGKWEGTAFIPNEMPRPTLRHLTNDFNLKTIDISVKFWHDRINGNTYFSAMVTLNYGMSNVYTFFLPYQYGYGDHYYHEAFKTLWALLGEDTKQTPWQWAEKTGVIIRTYRTDAKKRDLYRA